VLLGLKVLLILLVLLHLVEALLAHLEEPILILFLLLEQSLQEVRLSIYFIIMGQKLMQL